jgi:hypothetical protein
VSGVTYHHPWGALVVYRGHIQVTFNGRTGFFDLTIDDTKENIATLEAAIARAFEAGRKAELKHVRETLGIRE